MDKFSNNPMVIYVKKKWTFLVESRASLTDKRLYSILKDRHWCVSFSSVDVHTNNFRNGLSIVSEDRGKDDINVKSLRTDVTGVSILNRLH